MPRVYDQGRWYKVCASEDEIRHWKRGWPASGLPDGSVCGEFDKRNGDLVDHNLPEGAGEGSGAATALMDDLQTYGAAHLGIADQKRSKEWPWGHPGDVGGFGAASSSKCPRGTQVQSLLFDKSKFTVSQATKWARAHDFKPTKKPHVGPTRISVRVQSPKSCKVVGTISMGGKGVQAHVCCPKPGSSKSRR